MLKVSFSSIRATFNTYYHMSKKARQYEMESSKNRLFIRQMIISI